MTTEAFLVGVVVTAIVLLLSFILHICVRGYVNNRVISGKGLRQLQVIGQLLAYQIMVLVLYMVHLLSYIGDLIPN